MGACSQQAAAQSVSPLHGRPAPPRGRRPGGGSDRPRQSPGHPPRGRLAPRPRQGLPGRPHRSGHGADRSHRQSRRLPARRRFHSRGAGAPSPAPDRRGHPPRPPRSGDRHPRRGCCGLAPRAGAARCPDGGGRPRHRRNGVEPVEGEPRPGAGEEGGERPRGREAGHGRQRAAGRISGGAGACGRRAARGPSSWWWRRTGPASSVRSPGC